VLDLGLTPWRKDNADNVKPAGQVVRIGAHDKVFRHLNQLGLLGPGDIDFGVSLIITGTRFDFDEHQRVGIYGDEVDFTRGTAEVFPYQTVPLGTQKTGS